MITSWRCVAQSGVLPCLLLVNTNALKVLFMRNFSGDYCENGLRRRRLSPLPSKCIIHGKIHCFLKSQAAATIKEKRMATMKSSLAWRCLRILAAVILLLVTTTKACGGFFCAPQQPVVQGEREHRFFGIGRASLTCVLLNRIFSFDLQLEKRLPLV